MEVLQEIPVAFTVKGIMYVDTGGLNTGSFVIIQQPAHLKERSLKTGSMLYILYVCDFRLAFGNECGLAIVDIVQKTCLLNMGTPDLYGTYTALAHLRICISLSSFLGGYNNISTREDEVHTFHLDGTV